MFRSQAWDTDIQKQEPTLLTWSAIDNATDSKAHTYDEATDANNNNLILASAALNLITYQPNRPNVLLSHTIIREI